MAIPANVARLAFTGHLFGGEIFNTSLWFTTTVSSTIPSTNTDAQTLLDAILSGAKWTTLLAALAAMNRASCGYDKAYLYCYPTGGATATAQAEKTITAAGTSTLGTLPNQVCRVITLRTDQSGRRHRGRMYLPATGLAMDTSTGLFSASPQSLLDAISDWADQNRIDNDVLFAVVSQAGTNFEVLTSLKTDQRPDIQRRRANRELVGTTYTEAIQVD